MVSGKQVSKDAWAASDGGSLLDSGAALNSYRLASTPLPGSASTSRSNGIGHSGCSAVLEGLQAKPVSAASHRSKASGLVTQASHGIARIGQLSRHSQTPPTASAGVAKRLSAAGVSQETTVCYRVVSAVSTPAVWTAATPVETPPKHLLSPLQRSRAVPEPCWRWDAGGVSLSGTSNKGIGCAVGGAGPGSYGGTSTAQAVFRACQRSIRFLQQQALGQQAVPSVSLVASVSAAGPGGALCHAHGGTSGGSHLAAAAALAAMVKTAASEHQTAQWASLLQDSSGSPPAMPDMNPYSSFLTAGTLASPLLTDAAAMGSVTGVAPCMGASASEAGQLIGSSGQQLNGGSKGTVVVAGGLGGLGTMVAVVAAVGGSDSGTALLLLGRSGRAQPSVSLQARLQQPNSV